MSYPGSHVTSTFRLTAAAVAAAVSACGSSGVVAKPSAHPSAASPPPSIADPGGFVVAATRLAGTVELFHIGSDHKAQSLTTLSPPRAGLVATSVSLSAGPAPVASVIWAKARFEPGGTISYYLSGTSTGREVAGTTDATVVAVRADGRALAWVVDFLPNGQTDIKAGDLVDGEVRDVQRVVPDPARPKNKDDLFFGSVDRLAWAGDHQLALYEGVQDDEGGGVKVLPLQADSIKQGWLKAPGVGVPENDQPYQYFDQVQTADGTTALVIEREQGDGEYWHRQPRAVRVDLRTGRILEVVASPLPGRFVTEVSGGSRGVLYGTNDTGRQDSARFYARLPKELHGTPIVGLPKDVVDVVAQG
jgi:hypothetical protein